MQTQEPAADAVPGIYRSLVEQAPDAMIYADRDGAIRIWNGAAEAVFGYAAEEVLGRSLDMIIPERFRRGHWDGFHKAMESGQTKYAGRVLTTRSAHKNGGKLYVDLSFGLVRDGAGKVVGALAVGRDCTARHLAADKGGQAQPAP
ncbi:MAG: PAS domain S-box protein [Nevskia sp.]|nr:PAS domain S-box protein [Nevskia sp.]